MKTAGDIHQGRKSSDTWRDNNIMMHWQGPEEKRRLEDLDWIHNKN